MKTTYAGGILALFILTFTVYQCAKEKTPSVENSSEAIDRPVPRDIPPAPIRETPPPKPINDVISLSPSPALSPTPPPPTALTREIDLFAAFPQTRVMAEDFAIGVLQDGATSSRDFLKGLTCVRKFVDSIIKKNIDYSLVLPTVQAEIKAVLTYPLAQGYVPQKYRIGKMMFEQDDELRANIRLYKDEGITEGEIYLKKADDEWKISDLQAGFAMLGKPYRKSKEPFVPGSYTFLLGH